MKDGEVMLENQVAALTAILKDEDIRTYSGDAFRSLIKAVVFRDVTNAADISNDVLNIIFHTPTVLFWDKMQRYLFGTFRNYDEQVKMSQKFTQDNSDYEAFVKRQIHLINSIDDDKKVDCFAMLTRCFLLTDLEDKLFYKLARFISICTPEELAYIMSFDYEGKSDINAMISSLYQYGLFEQSMKENGGVDYVLSDFAKALKDDCLNFTEDSRGRERIASYEQIDPLNISEPATWEEIGEVIDRL